MKNEEFNMKSLENKIKALGWAVMLLDRHFHWIALNSNGRVYVSIQKPTAFKDFWGSEAPVDTIYSFDPFFDTPFIPNWRELCFSRKECEAWVKENLCVKNSEQPPTVKENLSVQFTKEEPNEIKCAMELCNAALKNKEKRKKKKFNPRQVRPNSERSGKVNDWHFIKSGKFAKCWSKKTSGLECYVNAREGNLFFSNYYINQFSGKFPQTILWDFAKSIEDAKHAIDVFLGKVQPQQLELFLEKDLDNER